MFSGFLTLYGLETEAKGIVSFTDLVAGLMQQMVTKTTKNNGTCFRDRSLQALCIVAVCF